MRTQTLRSGKSTHLSEQRRCSSAHGRWAAHVPKLSLEIFVSCAPVKQQAEKRHCRRVPCENLICIQFLSSVRGCEKSGSVRQLEDWSRKARMRISNIFHVLLVSQKASLGGPEFDILTAKTFSRSIAAISRCSMVLGTNLLQSKAYPSVMSTAPALLFQHAFKMTVNASPASRRPMRAFDGVNTGTVG